MDRLQRAIEVYVAWAEQADPGPGSELLARHPELRDLLEMMLQAPAPATNGDVPSQRRLGDFELSRELGRGGMGVVYEATQVSLDRKVAVKVLPGAAHLHPAALTRFKREAQLVAKLDHPGIVKVIAVGGHPDVGAWFAMELLEGQSLDAFLHDMHRADSRTPSHVRRMVEVAVAVAGALDHAHRAGILHRDVKPSNVILCKDGRAVLTDFGLARGAALPSVTHSGQLAGTPCYMAPEQTGGDQDDLDQRVDVYALGVTLYELLTLRRAFEGDSAHDVLRQVLSREPPDPRRINPAVPRDLAAVLGKAMAKRREHRYGSAADLGADLRAWLAGRPVSARLIGPGTRLFRWVRREPRLAGLVGALALVLVLGSAASLLLATRARSAAGRATDALTRLLRLADAQRLDDLRADEARLWPATPATLAAVDEWLRRSDDVEGRRELHAAALRELEAAVSASPELAWERNAQRALCRQLADIAPLREFVRARRTVAAGLEAATRASASAAAAWRELEPTLARDPRFAGVSVPPVLGLLPIGVDPQSRLPEFWHVSSGAQPRRGEDGRITPDGDMGIVLVLLPGAAFAMGSPPRPAGAPPLANADDEFEYPRHDVTLDPFFLAKYELTQGQCQRLLGRNPAYWTPEMANARDFPHDAADRSNPVERIAWADAAELARRADLCLPTEAQWEYACGAGTTTRYFTGDDVASLQGYANIADRTRRLRAGRDQHYTDAVDDGKSIHTGAGRFLANPFGLHDMAGNVAEWCADWAVNYETPPRPGDGARDEPGQRSFKIIRGGSFFGRVDLARTTARFWSNPGEAVPIVGVRLARRLRD